MKMLVRVAAAAVVVMCAVPMVYGQPTPRESLLVLSKREHTLSIVDPATLKVVAKMPVGADPHEVVASADGKTAWVSIYGGGGFHELSVLDLAGQKALPSYDLGALNGPHGLMFEGGKLWFTAEGAKVVGRLDPATNKVDWVMGTGQNRTHMVFVTADEKRVYTTNVASGTVSVIELTDMPPMGPPPPGNGPGMGGPGGLPPGAPGGPGGPPQGMPGMPRTSWVQTVIPVGKGDEGFDVTPDGKELWTANAQDGTISVIDLGTKAVVATLDANVPSANRLKFTPDGKLALVSTLRGGDLTVVDVASRKVVKRVAVGHGAAGIQMQPDGARAFVSCGPDNYVAVIDLKTLTVAGHIDAGGEPDGLAWAVQR